MVTHQTLTLISWVRIPPSQPRQPRIAPLDSRLSICWVRLMFWIADNFFTPPYAPVAERANPCWTRSKVGAATRPLSLCSKPSRCLHRDTPIRNGAAQPHGCATDFFPRRSAALVKFIFVFYGIKTERIGVIYADADWFFIDLFVIDDHNFLFGFAQNDKIICSMLFASYLFQSRSPVPRTQTLFSAPHIFPSSSPIDPFLRERHVFYPRLKLPVYLLSHLRGDILLYLCV